MALGFVVDAALSRILEDILALPDITADESHKISELCRILNSIEGLFVNMDEVSAVWPDFYAKSPLNFSTAIPCRCLRSFLAQILVSF